MFQIIVSLILSLPCSIVCSNQTQLPNNKIRHVFVHQVPIQSNSFSFQNFLKKSVHYCVDNLTLTI